MNTPEEAQTRLTKLHEAAWQLAALSLTLRDESSPDPDLRRAAERVLLEADWASTIEGPEFLAAELRRLFEASGRDPTKVASQAAAPVLQTAALLSGAREWTGQDDEALLAQGRASAQGPALFKAFAVPMMEGLSDMLAGPYPVMLDVGVGVAAMAAAWCEAFPGLRVVGLDVFDRALRLASRTLADAGMTDRVELRLQDVADLEERDVFCLAWLPAPFIPPKALERGLRHVVASLLPGGWVVVGHGKFAENPLAAAITRLQTVAFGGTPLDDGEAEDRLRAEGLELVASLPTPEGSPALSIGRRPRGPTPSKG